MSDDKVTVRTTMRPWEDLEVSPSEAASLQSQGILAEIVDVPDALKPAPKATGPAVGDLTPKSN